MKKEGGARNSRSSGVFSRSPMSQASTVGSPAARAASHATRPGNPAPSSTLSAAPSSLGTEPSRLRVGGEGDGRSPDVDARSDRSAATAGGGFGSELSHPWGRSAPGRSGHATGAVNPPAVMAAAARDGSGGAAPAADNSPVSGRSSPTVPSTGRVAKRSLRLALGAAALDPESDRVSASAETEYGRGGGSTGAPSVPVAFLVGEQDARQHRAAARAAASVMVVVENRAAWEARSQVLPVAKVIRASRGLTAA